MEGAGSGREGGEEGGREGGEEGGGRGGEGGEEEGEGVVVQVLCHHVHMLGHVLSWLFVVAGGHGGQSLRVIVCWLVRVGRLQCRCSPMDNDE